MKKIIFLSILCMITFLSACSFGESTEKKLSNILTEIYDSEKEYRDVQVNIAELEIKEQSSFLKYDGTNTRTKRKFGTIGGADSKFTR